VSPPPPPPPPPPCAMGSLGDAHWARTGERSIRRHGKVIAFASEAAGCQIAVRRRQELLARSSA